MGGKQGKEDWASHDIRTSRSITDMCAEYKKQFGFNDCGTLPKMCCLCLWSMKVYLTLIEVLSCESPVNLSLESGPLQTKVFDWALLALDVAPVSVLTYWPRQRCHPHQPIPHNFHDFISVFEGEENTSPLEIRTCHYWLTLQSVRCKTLSPLFYLWPYMTRLLHCVTLRAH